MEKDNKPTQERAATSNPVTWNEVLVAELVQLRPELEGKLKPTTFDSDPIACKENLREIYKLIASLAPPPSEDANPPPEAGTPPPEAKPPRGHLAALCLSGGGIRSATFNLGVLQGLAKLGLLSRIDYLSSVSGGGYIAAWLRTWIHRSSLATVAGKLANHEKNRDPLHPEPVQVTNLRDYSNYLTPTVGLFSGDTWAAAALVARNLLLNWLVLVPLMAAVIGLPLLFLLVVRTPGFMAGFHSGMLYAAIGVEALASLGIYSFRRFAKVYPTAQGLFIVFCVLPVLVAAALLSTAALGLNLSWNPLVPHPCCTDYSHLWRFSIVWCIGVPVCGWFLAQVAAAVPAFIPLTEPRLAKKPAGSSASPEVPTTASVPDYKSKLSEKKRARIVPWASELFGLLASGAIGAVMLVALARYAFSYLYHHPALYVMLVLPALLGIYLVSRVLFVGFSSVSESFRRWRSLPPDRSLSEIIFSEDADREWWARLSGWVLLIMVVWLAVTGICMLGSYIPDFLGHAFSGQPAQPCQPCQPVPPAQGPTDTAIAIAKWLVSAIGALSGAIAALTGSSAKTPATANAAKKSTPATKVILAITGPLFIVCLIIVLSWGVKALGAWIADRPELFNFSQDRERVGYPLEFWMWRSFPVLVVGLAAISCVAGVFVNVNRFSLHGMYRNRLVRAYLGASNSIEDTGMPRIPDPFTGFAMTDNVALHDLRHGGRLDPTQGIYPLPIINTTLNLVHGTNLAWQQRKAESFSMTPLYCGNWSEGYRDSREYGGSGGITVGTAITISGAAANPNMGYSSSPALSFLMALFNVRLGAWLGNTNERGSSSYRNHGPRQALIPLFSEMFGLTNSNRSYVNLSDGGHFDNLGLYEVVLRRCRRVLVSDAGADGKFFFDDLGNAIRKIRIDFGINITFEKTIRILPNGPGKRPGLYCATALIRYSGIDGEDAEDGKLIYIKPSLRGRETQVLPYDVYSYSRGSEEFPHESTVDQWFTESQFESYRTLGAHILEQMTGGSQANPREDLFDAFYRIVTEYAKDPPSEPPGPNANGAKS